jgi:hypothetical protein
MEMVKLLLKYSLENTEENHEKSLQEHLVTETNFKLGTPQTQTCYDTTTPTCSMSCNSFTAKRNCDPFL